MRTKLKNYFYRLSWHHISSSRIAKILIQKRTLFFGCVIMLTLLSVFPASGLKTDASGVSFTTDNSREYKDYLAFVESFGTDDYILLVVKNSHRLSDPELKKRIKTVHDKLRAMDSILGVTDLDTINSSGLFKLFGTPHDENQVATLRQTVPGLGRLISDDMKNLGFIVRIDNEKLNGFRLEKKLHQMKSILVNTFPEHPHCYAAGIPVLRSAFERYNLENAIIFGALGLLFGTLIAFYLFKTLWAPVLVLVISLTSLIWTLGIMGALNIELNLASGLSFGFILVVSTTTVFHILTTYFQLSKIETKETALTKTFQTIIYPCFMCALTTATGFSSLILSPVPMVRQAGVVISIGVMLTFFLTLLITAFSLPKLLKLNGSDFPQKEEGRLEKGIKACLTTGFRNPGLSVLTGIVFITAMGAGIPGIQTVKHLTPPFIKSTPEAKDLEYIGQHISTGTSFSIILESRNDNFSKRKFWYDLIQFEKDIKSIPGIMGVESLTRLIFSLALKFSPTGIAPEKVFHHIQNRSPDMIRPYFDPVSNKLRLIVHIQSRTSDQVETVLTEVQNRAGHIYGKIAGVKLSGQLILLRSQTTDLVSSQISTLFLALFVISILMMIQLRSFVLGLLSLIPNLLPLITIFGVMGWFNIPLDPLTIFAATISFGLSVDDSIHFLTRFKREMRAQKNGRDIRDCLKSAYQKTAGALVSTTAVLFLSALGLLFSSFSHVFSLGVLISSASVTALIGDLIFLPGIVLTFRPLNRLLSGKIKKAAE